MLIKRKTKKYHLGPKAQGRKRTALVRTPSNTVMAVLVLLVVGCLCVGGECFAADDANASVVGGAGEVERQGDVVASDYSIWKTVQDFLGVILGAAVSLVTTILVLRNSRYIHKENIREEQKKTKEEREFAAKKGALLNVSDAMARFLDYYVSIPDRPISQEGVVAEEITNLNVALNKIHFFCALETIEKVTELSIVLGSAFLDAMKARISSALISGDIKAIDISIAGLEEMNAQTQEEINANLSAGGDSMEIARRYEQKAENFRMIAKRHGEKVELVKNKYVEIEKCRDVVRNDVGKVLRCAQEVLLLARKELSFPVDENNYRELVSKQTETMGIKLEDYFREVRNEVMARMDDKEEEGVG